jgi:glycosyltransferase involved in cell wall biosynthesis
VKILHLIPSLKGGGAERFASQLISSQRKAGLDAVACVFYEDACDPEWCRDIPKIYNLNYKPARGYFSTISSRMLVARMKQVFNEFSPAIVHSHLWPACKLACRSVSSSRAQHIYHIHDLPSWLHGGSYKASFHRFLIKRMIKKANAHLVTCSYDAGVQSVRAFKDNRRVHVINNGVDVNCYKPAIIEKNKDKDIITIVMVAAFRPGKGHAMLIDSVNEMGANKKKVRVLLAGHNDTVVSVEIKNKIEKFGLVDQFKFLGQVNDMASLLVASDIIVLPSESEGLPLSILEGMACGLPVVATNVGGIPEVVIEGETGFLLNTDDIRGFAKRLEQLVESFELRKKFGEKARELILQKFNFDITSNNITELYKQLL